MRRRWSGPYASPERVGLPRIDLLQQASQRASLVRIRGQEDHADAVSAGGGKFDAGSSYRPSRKKGMRHLEQDAGAVAGVGLAAACAAVAQVHQGRQRLAQDPVGALAVDIGDEADATRIVLPAWIVKSVIEHTWIGHVHECVLSLPGAGVPPVVRTDKKKRPPGTPQRVGSLFVERNDQKRRPHRSDSRLNDATSSSSEIYERGKIAHRPQNPIALSRAGQNILP